MPSNNIWANNTPQGEDTEPHEVILPSGQECLARKLGMPELLAAGVLNEVDALTGLVARHTRKVKGAKGQPDGEVMDEGAILADPEGMKTIIGLTDRILPVIVVSPSVILHYETITFKGKPFTKRIPVEKRIPGQVYTDQIDLMDKLFLFQWAMSSENGQVRALESFRGDASADVGGVADVAGVSRPAQRNSRGKRRR